MLTNISCLGLNTISKHEFERLLNENKPELLDNLSRSKNEIVKTADIILGIIKHADLQIERKEHLNEWSSVKKIWNVSGFILFASLDLKTYLELMIISNDAIQKTAITRMVYIQLYEIARTIDELTNIRFVEEIRKIEAAQYVDLLFEKRKKLSELRKKYEKELFDVRINVGAHREKNFAVFHDYLCSVEYTASIQLIFDFGNVIDELGGVLQTIMNQSAAFIKDTYE